MLACSENYRCHIPDCRHKNTHIWDSDCDYSCHHIKRSQSQCMVINVINDTILNQGLLLVNH